MTDSPNPPPAAPVNASTPSPSTVIGGGVGISLSVVIVWAVETFAHVQVPGVVAAALGALLSAVAGYFPPGGRLSTVVPK